MAHAAEGAPKSDTATPGIDSRNPAEETALSTKARRAVKAATDKHAGRRKPRKVQPPETRRISLSAGLGKDPAPPSRHRNLMKVASLALALSVIALLWELAHWYYFDDIQGKLQHQREPLLAQEREPPQAPIHLRDYRLRVAIVAIAFLALSLIKVAAENKMAIRALRKLHGKLEDSFKHPSTVRGSWVRAGPETHVGFGAVNVTTADADTVDAARSNGGSNQGKGAAGDEDAFAGASSILTVRQILEVRITLPHVFLQHCLRVLKVSTGTSTPRTLGPG